MSIGFVEPVHIAEIELEIDTILLELYQANPHDKARGLSILLEAVPALCECVSQNTLETLPGGALK